MVHMARAYITEKQMPRNFWFYAVVHAARMMNAIPGRHSGWLVSPFLLVHGVGHDEHTWIPLFSIAYFHQDCDGDESRSHHQAHTMDGIVIGRSPKSNALLVYNPRNKKCYEPDSYCLDPYCLPVLAYPSIKFDGGLFVSLLRDDNPQFEEKYSPGTRVERLDPSTLMLLSGTVMDIPLSPAASGSVDDLAYTILFDNGTTASVPLRDMSVLIPPPPIALMVGDSVASLLPPFLQVNSRITYEHEGQYHKGYLGLINGVYRFSFKSHVNKRKEDWGVPLPNLPTTWVDLCIEGILIPGHVAHSRSFILLPLQSLLLLTPSLRSLARLISIAAAHHHSLKRYQLLTLIAKYGFKAFTRKRGALKPWPPTQRYPKRNIVIFMIMEHHVPFLQCVF
jgi:hypothetical protein